MSSGRRDWWLLFPILIPAMLFAAGNRNFGFDPEGWLDPFVYVGYFWHYPEHLPVFDGNYKISRLPWILPGYAAYLLGLTAGPLLLGYLTLLIVALATYLLVRDALGDRTVAAVAAAAFACCTQAHGVGGWAYHVLAAGGYYLLACWFVLRSAIGASPTRSVIAAGACYAAAIHTHLFLVAFAPLLALLYWAAGPRPLDGFWRRSLGDALLFVAGGVALTAVLGAANAFTGGDWLFFVPQIEQALRLTEPGRDEWWMGDAGRWLPTALYLVLPAAFLIAGLPALLRRAGDREGRLARAFVAQAWLALAIMLFFQFVRRQTTLDYYYMAFPIYLHAFPCLAAALAGWRAVRQGASERPVIAAAAAAVVLGALLFLLPAPLPQWMSVLSISTGLAALPPIGGPLVVAVAGVVAMFAVPRPVRLLVFAAWFSVVNTWIAPSPSSYGFGTPGVRREMLALFREADTFTTELDTGLTGIKYWIADERVTTPAGDVDLAAVFNSFVATRTWLTNLLGRTSPGAPIHQLTATVFERGPCIGLLSSTQTQPKLQHEMMAHFERLGRPLQEVAVRRFERPNLSFALTVLKEPDPPGRSARAAALRPPCLP